MSKKLKLNLVLLGVITLLLCLAIGVTAYFNNLPQHLSQHETIILGQSRLSPGSQAVLRVLTRDSRNASPLPGTEVRVTIQPSNAGPAQLIYTGKTDDEGMAVVSFRVPDEAETNQVLKIYTRSKLGAEQIERELTLERNHGFS